VLTGWKKVLPSLAERIGRRVVADFTKAGNNQAGFEAAVGRLLSAIRVERPLDDRNE
jgi:hypothetical protein